MDADKTGPTTPDQQGHGAEASASAIQAVLASLATQQTGLRQPPPGELKWRLTTLIFPAILLLFVALYVTSLSAGVEPEIALFRAGGAGVVLAVLGRVAVGILGDDTRLILNDRQIIALAQDENVRSYFSGAETEHDSDGTDQPSPVAQTADAGGKE